MSRDVSFEYAIQAEWFESVKAGERVAPTSFAEPWSGVGTDRRRAIEAAKRRLAELEANPMVSGPQVCVMRRAVEDGSSQRWHPWRMEFEVSHAG